MHAAKQIARRVEGPAPAGVYKVGAPYRIGGMWYYPQADYEYRETGIASWYGPGFHGRRTANGEVYDQYALTAAHRTLPMPSIVRIANLENGRSIKVRVNDRGPFKNGRIIDVSRRAAELLAFRSAGTAKVRVEIVEDESRRAAADAEQGQSAASAPPRIPWVVVTSEPLPNLGGISTAAAAPVPGQIEAAVPRQDLAAGQTAALLAAPKAVLEAVVVIGPVNPTEIYVQVGAFRRFHFAVRLRARLSGLGDVRIGESDTDGKRFFRVRIGPVGSVPEADGLLDLLVINGYTDARVVVE